MSKPHSLPKETLVDTVRQRMTQYGYDEGILGHFRRVNEKVFSGRIGMFAIQDEGVFDPIWMKYRTQTESGT